MIFKLFFLCCVFVSNTVAYEGDNCQAGGVAGICTRITECPEAIRQIKKGIRPTDCGYIGITPLVCCVPESNEPTTTTTRRTDRYEDQNRVGGCEDVPESLTSPKTGQKAFDKCIEYQEKYVYPCERVVAILGGLSRTKHCHHNVDKLIVGGNDSSLYEFPHMVMLGYGDSIESATWNCGGSIISENFVLSAAHCLFNIRLKEPKFVVAGAHTRSDTTDRSKVIEVKRVIKYPVYESPIQYHDIGLVETRRKIPLSQFVVPACLHVGDQVSDDRVLATGWGHTTDRGAVAEIMQKVILNKFTTEECSLKFPEYRLLPEGFDPKSQTCYGDKSEVVDTCQGDSGGPLQIKSKKIHCMYTIVGVTSFGRKCGVIAEPAIYTKVSYYVPWIESIVWP